MVSTIRFFGEKDLTKIIDPTIELLCTLGIKIPDKRIRNLLTETGATF